MNFELSLSEELTNLIAAAFERAGYDGTFGAVTASSRPDLCQFQCNGALSAAKQYKTNPFTIATEVAAALESTPESKELAVNIARPGFINITVSDTFLAARMNAMLADSRLLLPKTGTPKKIVLDYGGPNAAKHMHVGHLRSAVIGDALYRICDFLGHNMISDIHLGDWGTPIGLVIAYMERKGQHDAFDDNTLLAMYTDAAALAKTDADFANAAQVATIALQDGNEEYLRIWREIHDVSLGYIREAYAALNVRPFDCWYGESDAQRYIPDVLSRLEERNILKDDDGAKVIELRQEDDREPMPPMIVVKRGGGVLYATTDLATILQREQEWQPDEMWYLTDARQSLHFKQLFRAAHLAGLTDAKLSHTGFGTVNGADGKPYKTRAGGVMRLADMIDEVREKLPDSRVACAAIRIADLQNRPDKDYRFDLDRFTATEGKTGPYLQYTAVRIASVLAKSGEEVSHYTVSGKMLCDSERALMLSLDAMGASLQKAFDEQSPSVLCEALFELCAKFNTFYGEQRVLSEPDTARRSSLLALLSLTRRMLLLLLDLLGVEVPEEM